MGYIADVTEHYFSTTTPEQQKRDWEELKKYNVGPDILDVINNYGKETQFLIPYRTYCHENIVSLSSSIVRYFNDDELYLSA
jgi:hypothetical protein